jgi:uncharacterized protein YjdB
MTQRLISCAFLLVIGTFVIGCQANPSPTVKSLTIAGTAPTVGAAKQFTVTATFLDGSTRDVTNDAPGIVGPFWSSGTASVATVSSTGLVTGVAQGSVAIQVRYHSFTSTAVIQIN